MLEDFTVFRLTLVNTSVSEEHASSFGVDIGWGWIGPGVKVTVAGYFAEHCKLVYNCSYCGLTVSFLLLIFRFLSFTICNLLLLIFPFILYRSAFVWSRVILMLVYHCMRYISFFINFIISIAELSSWCSLPTSLPRIKHFIQFLFVFCLLIFKQPVIHYYTTLCHDGINK
jgi:hypothetical protein